MSTNYVIYDCNGSVDDAWALALLLKADSIGKIKLLAVTCVPGPITRDRAARNMRKVLVTKGRDDIPIFRGAATRFMPQDYDTSFEHPYDHHHNNHNHHHHSRGDDVFDEILPKDFMEGRAIENKHAVTAIRDFVYQFPNQVTIITTGPLTNVALSLAIYGSEFAPLIKALFIMGGAYQAVGNITRGAEFISYLDPEAGHIISVRDRAATTVLPWENCLKDRFSISSDWRFNVLGANKQDEFISLMNRLERPLVGHGGHSRHLDWIPYDAMIVAVFLFGIHFVITKEDWNVRVELFGKYTRGETILDHLKDLTKNPINATVVQKVDAAMFKMIIMWAAGYPGADSDYIQGLL